MYESSARSSSFKIHYGSQCSTLAMSAAVTGLLGSVMIRRLKKDVLQQSVDPEPVVETMVETEVKVAEGR